MPAAPRILATGALERVGLKQWSGFSPWPVDIHSTQQGLLAQHLPPDPPSELWLSFDGGWPHVITQTVFTCTAWGPGTAIPRVSLCRWACYWEPLQLLQSRRCNLMKIPSGGRILDHLQFPIFKGSPT